MELVVVGLVLYGGSVGIKYFIVNSEEAKIVSRFIWVPMAAIFVICYGAFTNAVLQTMLGSLTILPAIMGLASFPLVLTTGFLWLFLVRRKLR